MKRFPLSPCAARAGRRAFFSIPAGSGASRFKTGAITIPHLIEQPYPEVEDVRVFLPELQVYEFTNIQIEIRLKGEAGVADVRAHPLLGDLSRETLADDTHGYADLYPVFPAPPAWRQYDCRCRKTWINRVPHSKPIGKFFSSLSFLGQMNQVGK